MKHHAAGVGVRRLIVAGVVLCAALAGVTTADAWTLWIEHDVMHLYANKVPETSGTWQLQGVFATIEQCAVKKEQSWQRVVSQYDDLSRFPAIASLSSIPGEAVFMEMSKRQNVVGGHENQHFHCLPDSLDPRH